MADFKFRCPECQQKIAVDESAAGVQVECPSCRSALIIPVGANAPVHVVIRRRVAVLTGRAETTLRKHIALCDETYQLILDENHLLKQTSEPPDRNFLDRKQQLLVRLDASLKAIRAMDKAEARGFRPLIDKAQQVVMKTLLLDRENEQLLLKCTLSPKPVATSPRPSLSHLQKIYGRH